MLYMVLIFSGASLSPLSSYFLSGCEKDVQRVCSGSPEEHLQPFKDKMETFALSGEWLQSCIVWLQTHITSKHTFVLLFIIRFLN